MDMTEQHSTVQYNSAHYSAVQYDCATAIYLNLKYSTWYCTVQYVYSTVLYCAVHRI